MGGFIDPFIPSPGWPQDSTVFAGSSWASSASSLAGSSAAHAMEFHLRNGSTPTFMSRGGSAKELGGGPVFPGGTVLSSTPTKLHDEEEEELLLLQSDGGLDFGVDAAAGTLGSILGAPVSLTATDSAPVSNDSSGSEQSGAGLPQFLLGEQPAAWPPAYAGIIPSIAGEETSQSFGFGGISSGDDLLHEAAAAACAAPNGKNNTYQHHLAPPQPQLQLQLLQHDDAGEFSCSGKLLSFAPAGMDALQMDQKEFSGGLHHLDLSSLVVPGPGPPPPLAAPFNTTGSQNGAGGAAAPKLRVRARRGQATDPHSIAERLRREKISVRMKNLQELVPNSNKTDKASMLEEIIEYIKFLQLQTKVLSMSRLGATEAVVPLLTESQNESSGLLLSPRSRSGEMQHGGGGEGEEELFQGDSAALEQEIAQLMENNMTAAMQYLQSRGLCLMPIALASAISTKKGTSSAAVWPQPGDGCSGGGDKGHVEVAGLKPLGSLKEMKYKIN